MWLASVFLFALLSHSIVAQAKTLTQEFRDNPPTYCAAVNTDVDKKKFKSEHAIPLLTEESLKIPGLQLQQVQVIIRHGTRTIWKHRPCWKGYTANWNCTTGESVTAWRQSSDVSNGDKRDIFLFNKIFNARPQNNVLPGICELGQLLSAGYEQFHLNGEILADTYFNKAANKLFLYELDKALSTGASLDNVIYFRSTEYQRTRMSGAQLLTSMIKKIKPDATDPKIPMHVIDKTVDPLRPTIETCYDLVDAHNKALSGTEYTKRFGKKHAEARELAEQMFPGGEWPWEAQDCLFSNICANLQLPEDELWNRANVEKVMAATQEEYEWEFRANNARFSRIAMVQFVLDIKMFAIKHLCSDSGNLEDCAKTFFDDENERKKHVSSINEKQEIKSSHLVVWSGHETTIGPFLATFGDKFWNAASTQQFPPRHGFEGLKSPFPGYASLLSLEFYSSNEGPLFRMIYNSMILTPLINGCSQELCSIKELFKEMSWASVEFAEKRCTMEPAPESLKEIFYLLFFPPPRQSSSANPIFVVTCILISGFFALFI